jgi:outer membrane protein TolC
VDAERDDGEWSVGPAVATPIPLFDFGQARRARARAAVIEARHNLTQARREVVEQTRRAHASLSASNENLARIRDRLVPSLESRLEQAEAQFKAGQVDITQLLLAEQELRAARTHLVELQRRSTEAVIRLQRAAGGPGVAGSTDGETQTSTQTQPEGIRR